MTPRLLALLTASAVHVFCLAGSALAQGVPGEAAFKARCGSCHTVQPGQNRIGPQLSKVVGRRAGSEQGAIYSQAMKAADIVWTPETLDAYLANPRRMVPGTTMLVSFPNAGDREQIIAYLRFISPKAE